MEERRRFTRYSFKEEVLVDGIQLCTSYDISEEGMYISTIQTFDKGSIIELTIPYKDGKIRLKAEVRYTQPGIGMGVKFIDLDNEIKEKIRNIIDSIK
jgi:hypothetical protein